jgi:hypothetical protein
LAQFKGDRAAQAQDYRELRARVRNLNALLQDAVPLDEDHEAAVARVRAELSAELVAAATAAQRKVLVLTKMLEHAQNGETVLRRRAEAAELRAANAEERIVELELALADSEVRLAVSLRERAYRR